MEQSHSARVSQTVWLASPFCLDSWVNRVYDCIPTKAFRALLKCLALFRSWCVPVMFSSPVNPFAPGWESMCNNFTDCEDITNHNILKARDRIEEFFRSQAYILHHRSNLTIPAMHFVDHSFQVTRIDNCRPGFGKNEGLHSNCASCCVVCSPGTFSPDVDVTCQICASAHVYGAKACP